MRKKIFHPTSHLKILFACGKIANLLQESLGVCMGMCMCMYLCVYVLFPLSELGSVFTEFPTGRGLN